MTQTEPFIARHPLNDSILFVAANTINLNTGFISEGIYVSSDRGATWYGSDTCAGGAGPVPSRGPRYRHR